MTKKFRTLGFGSILVGAALLGATAVKAEIAHLNINQVMSESKAVKEIQAKIEGSRKEFQKTIDAEEAKLRKEEEKLISDKDAGKLTPAKFEEKKKDFGKKVAKLEKKVYVLKAGLQEGFQNAMKKVQENVEKIAGEVANAKGYNQVLPQSVFIVKTSQNDITKEVQDRLNKELPSVKMEIGKPALAGAIK